VSALVSDDVFENYGNNEDQGNVSALQSLGSLSPEDLFHSKVTDASMAACCLSGLWLLHNFLDRSHSISQDINSPEGSYWHGIMHRMEGDFGNSKYWGRQVGHHPVFETLNQQTPGGWSYNGFVDACENAAASGTPDPEVHKIAVAEWVALFEYCTNRAVG
jgi:hypothetical protein